MENSELSAFPRNEKNSMAIEYQGLTKREYFAAMAMQGLLVRYVENGMYGNQINYPMVEQAAVMQADALINELHKPTT